MLEQVVYDDSGQLLTGSYMDYTMPRAANLPFYSVHHASTVCPSNPLGIKGCGEAGTVGACAAVMNAIQRALDPLDVGFVDMPATPDRLWKQIQSAS